MRPFLRAYARPFTIPIALDALVMECLAKNPDDRPASAFRVSERLAAAVSIGAWTVAAARVWWQRRRPVTRLLATNGAATAEGRRSPMAMAPAAARAKSASFTSLTAR